MSIVTTPYGESYGDRWLRDFRERPAKQRAARQAAAGAGKEFDTDSDDAIICPWCASEFEPDDPANWDKGLTETCDACDKQFTVEVEYSVSYQTARAEA